MTTATDHTLWLNGPPPWCAICQSFLVRSPAHYECPICKPAPYVQAPVKLQLDLPTPRGDSDE